MSLRPAARSGRLWPVDPVDGGAAGLLDAARARSWGVLPFARGRSALYVAAAAPPPTAVLEALRALAPGGRLHLCRAAAGDLAAALRRTYGTAPRTRPSPSAGGAPRRLGEWLVRQSRVSAADVEAALDRQAEWGGRLGQVLVGLGLATHGDVADALARQTDHPLVDLLAGGEAAGVGRLDPELFALMPAEFWWEHLLVPLGRRRGRLTVAMADPSDIEALRALQRVTGSPPRVAVTGYRDVSAAMETVYHQAYDRESRVGLLRRRPDDCALRTLTRPQAVGFGLIAAALAAAAVVRPALALVAFNAVAECFYLGLSVLKLTLMRTAASARPELALDEGDVDTLDAHDLPVYTVLVPAYREAAVLPTIARALAALDYPKDRLDVKLLLEADDAETLAAARNSRLPAFIEIVKLPPSVPRTKPKACNYGLQRARGDYVVIYDAEDIPEPDQLRKAVAAFRRARPDVACIQAKLSYFNVGQNLLTRWFTIEYAMWFDLLLPGLYAARLPIPLGGTSNHFRTDVLRQLGAWDPFNVAEDADLGVRLYKAGYATAVMDSTTLEEANSEFVNWVRQRSRWVKGYLQTWLVHMRHPWRLLRELRARGTLGFHLVVGGTPFTLLLNPVYWALTTLWFLYHWGVVPRIFPSWVYYTAGFNLVVGNFAFTYANVVGVARRGQWSLVRPALLSPLYWAMMSVGAWKALLQLVTRPSYWEKTVHGLADEVPEVGQRLQSGVARAARAS